MRKINNYDDLVAERKMVEGRIVEQKAAINDGIDKLKQKFEPFLYLLPVLSIFGKKTGNDNSILKTVSSIGIDLLGQRVLSKSNWFTRLLVPLFLKAVSSRVMGSGKRIEAGQDQTESTSVQNGHP